MEGEGLAKLVHRPAIFTDEEREEVTFLLDADTPRRGEDIEDTINRVYAMPQRVRERWQALQTGGR